MGKTQPTVATHVLLLLCGAFLGFAQETPPSRYQAQQVEAAFLYHFAKFVTWPAQAFPTEASPITIGFLGEDPLSQEVETTVKDKNLNGHPFRVLRLNLKDLPEARHCHILFIAPAEKKRLKRALEAVEGASTLTVSRMDGFIEAGGIINFFTSEDKVRFQIDDAAARRAGLKISAKLLSLARNPEHP